MLAVLIAPLSTPVIVVVVPAVLTHSQPFGNGLLLVIFFSTSISYSGMLVGLPRVLFLERRGLLTFLSLALSGSVIGVVAFAGFLYVFALMLGTRKFYNPLQGLWGIPFGLAVAVVFALIAGITNRRAGSDNVRR